MLSTRKLTRESWAGVMLSASDLDAVVRASNTEVTCETAVDFPRVAKHALTEIVDEAQRVGKAVCGRAVKCELASAALCLIDTVSDVDAEARVMCAVGDCDDRGVLAAEVSINTTLGQILPEDQN